MTAADVATYKRNNILTLFYGATNGTFTTTNLPTELICDVYDVSIDG
jgi:hypothetical protein